MPVRSPSSSPYTLGLVGLLALGLSQLPTGSAHGEAVDAGTDATLVEQTTTAVVPDGRYRLLEAESVDAATRAAIDAVISGLHPAMREPFRVQLGATMRAPRRLQLGHREADVVLDFDGHELVAPLGGEERRQPGPEGRPVRVVHRLEGSVLVQELRSGQFTLVQRFVVEGARVRLETELRSGMLPRPVSSIAHYAPITEP